MGLAFIIAIADLALKYGIPLAIDLAKTWSDDLGGKEPTLEDFEALRNLVPDPETYFQERV